MLLHVFLLLFTYCLHSTFANGHCIDIHSHIVSQGLHYVPGPNTCTLCICDKGSPKWCKSVLCSPPQNCKSFEVGASCCEFKCLDGILTKNDNYNDTYDLALRLLASAVTAVLSLSLLFFLIHRLKQRKIRVRQNRQVNEDQRSLNSIGYIAGSLGYLPGSIGYLGAGNNDMEFHYEESGVHYPLWKPPGNYFPRGEAPPPYDEAVRSARVDNGPLNGQIRTENNITVAHTTNVNISPMQQATVSSYRPSVTVQQTNPKVVQCRHESTITNANATNSSQEYANITIQSVTIHQKSDNSSQSAKESSDDASSNTEAVRRLSYNVHDKNAIHKGTHSDRRNENSKSYENIVIHSRNEWPTTTSGGDGPNKCRTLMKNQRENRDGVSGMEQLSATKMNRYENVAMKNGNSMLKDVYALKKLVDNDALLSMRPEFLYDDLNGCDRFYENTRHRTIPNLQEFQLKDIPRNKEPSIRGMVDVTPKRELDKSRFGERSLESNLMGLVTTKDRKDVPLHRTLPKNLRELCIPASVAINSAPTETLMNRSYSNNLMHRSLPKHLSMQVETPLSLNLAKQSYINYTECNAAKDNVSLGALKSSVIDLISPQSRVCNIEMEDLAGKSNVAVANNDVDDDKCEHISYQCLSSVPDEDDYRSECENCKSSGYQEGDGEDGDMVNETMTLQRRPLEPGEEVPYYRTSLTLPTHTRKPRAVTPNPGRESWFMAMQETSSSDDSD